MARRPGRGGHQSAAARILRPEAGGGAGLRPWPGPATAGAGRLPRRPHHSRLFHHEVVRLSEDHDHGAGAVETGRRGPPATTGGAPDVPPQHPQQPEPVRALRRHPPHRR